MPAALFTAVVAQTQKQAVELAALLGFDEFWAFGVRSESTFEGMRADRILIDAEARISDRFLDTIYATAAKSRGRVVFVSAHEYPRGGL